MFGHLIRIVLFGFLGTAILISTGIVCTLNDPIETVKSLPLWSYPLCVFMFLGGMFSDGK